ncbi:MAG: hypothetical protein R6W75_08475, partial [Smithellaceae bacterium]
GDTDKAEEFMAGAMKLNPDFEEGCVFYIYLMKLNHPQSDADDVPPSAGFFEKILKKVQGLKKVLLDRKTKIDHDEPEDRED